MLFKITTLYRYTIVILTGLILSGADVASAVTPEHSASAVPHKEFRELPLKTTIMTGDFNEMFKKRMIRVAVPFSRSLYFIDKGHERGISAVSIRDFELFINKKYASKLKRRAITVYIIPTTRDKLLQTVVNGTADIATGNLTITENRLHDVDFIEMAVNGINEIVVTGPQAPQLHSVDDLSGKTIHVSPSSSYHESLLALNDRFIKAGRPPAELILLPDALEDEDKLEMLNVGLLDILVMDNWKANLWTPVLPNIKLRQDLVLRTGSHIGWAVRKGSSDLQREIEEFLKQPGRKQAPSYQYKQLMKKVKGLKNNAKDKELQKFQQTLAMFQVYGRKYRFDPLLLAAQGYQESKLDQKARSHVGAIGVMQVMPRTGAEMKVGNIKITEPNIHAGTKYLNMLMDRYFSNADFSEMDRSLFAFAAYNAGPGNISRMRREAAKRNLDPNVWFNNVEMITAERIGSETTTYVRNIFKYYTAYKLVTERQKEQEKARQQVTIK